MSEIYDDHRTIDNDPLIVAVMSDSKAAFWIAEVLNRMDEKAVIRLARDLAGWADSVEELDR